jgi:DNA transformation protein and related proteins
MRQSENEFLNYILECLEEMDGISWGRMFGGYVVRRYNLPIGLVFDDELYFKVNDRNLADYQSLGSQPFSYEKKGKTISISNWRVPAEVLEDVNAFICWAHKAYLVAEDAVRK